MVIALVGLALAMIAAGLWSVYEGYGIIVLERGWALVISGATVASLGAVLLGIAVVASRLGAIRAELGRQRERMSRPEPNFPDPPDHMDPVLAVSSGLLAGGASDPGPAMPAPPPRPQPAALDETDPLSDASHTDPAPAAPPAVDRQLGAARMARREVAAQRRARRSGSEGAQAQPVSAGTLAAGAAAAVAAGAVVSAGLAAVRGRGEGGDAASPPSSGEPTPRPRLAGDASPTQALRGLDQPFAEGPVGDELLPGRDSEPAGAQRPPAGPVAWPVVPNERAGNEPAFPAGGVQAPKPSAPVEEDAPYATSAPVVPDTSNAEDAPGDGAEPPAVLGTYNSGGNRYVMFADGSIEAETPDGTFRFGSLDELKVFIAAGGERPREG